MEIRGEKLISGRAMEISTMATKVAQATSVLSQMKLPTNLTILVV